MQRCGSTVALEMGFVAHDVVLGDEVLAADRAALLRTRRLDRAWVCAGARRQGLPARTVVSSGGIACAATPDWVAVAGLPLA